MVACPRYWRRPTSTRGTSPSRSAEQCRAARYWSEMTKVLVVEDNPANMTLSTFLLESAGHSVLKATDAETGVALARAEHPDLILMDIQLQAWTVSARRRFSRATQRRKTFRWSRLRLWQ